MPFLENTFQVIDSVMCFSGYFSATMNVNKVYKPMLLALIN